jgi:hypothetical protein
MGHHADSVVSYSIVADFILVHAGITAALGIEN